MGFVDEKSRLNLIFQCSIIDSICDFSSPLVSSFSLNWLLHRQMCLVAPIEIACNYDPAATLNDGSCDFVSCLVLGCTDAAACNYDVTATVNDGSCD